MSDATRTLSFDQTDAFRRLCGTGDRHLKQIGGDCEVVITARGNTLTLRGEEQGVELAARTMSQLYEISCKGHPLSPPEVSRGLRIVAAGDQRSLSDVFLDTVLITTGKRRIAPKNLNQKLYVDAIRAQDLVFGIGPAGTGKTYLAMAMAVAALTTKQVKRIILTRPAVEAGERLGFLPGDMAEKVNPYLRPLYDALYDMLDFTRVERLMSEQIIEVAPLAFMRGRTLNNAFVILDEAQNATREQMKMFLTRLGFDAKAVVTGDVTQTDLEDVHRSGLVHAQRVLHGIEGIHIQQFEAADVVRHPLVMRIIDAYQRAEDAANSPRRSRDDEAPEGDP